MEKQNGKVFLGSALSRIKGKEEPNKVPDELQAAINECTTLMDLKDLLFSIDFYDEPTIKAFEKRLNQLLESKRI